MLKGKERGCFVECWQTFHPTPGSAELAYDVHFWIGSGSSQVHFYHSFFMQFIFSTFIFSTVVMFYNNSPCASKHDDKMIKDDKMMMI